MAALLTILGPGVSVDIEAGVKAYGYKSQCEDHHNYADSNHGSLLGWGVDEI